jgi:hypothetical protein
MDNLKYALIVLLGAGICGCSSNVAVSSGPVSLAGTNKARVMTVAQDVLADIGFSLEKADTDQGYLSTKPLRGGQFFEVWRHDNASASAGREASIQSIQRTAQINITENGASVTVACNVDVRRLSLPENDYITQSRSAAMFTSSSASRQRLEIAEDQAQYTEWIDLGRDAALENRILQLIQHRLGASEG